MIVYLARAIQAFVMYCVNGTSRSSLLIESTDSMIYTQLGPGLVPDPAVPPRRAGSSPIASYDPTPIGVQPARLRHQPGCTRLARRPTGRDQLDPPLQESSRQINELCVVRPFVCANCVRVYRFLFIYYYYFFFLIFFFTMQI